MRNLEHNEKEYFKELDYDKKKDLARKYGIEKIGRGAEAEVIGSKKTSNGKEEVVAHHYMMPPPVAKILFYYARLLSTLFPHNFPKIHQATGGSYYSSGESRQETDSDLAFTIRERIRPHPSKEYGIEFHFQQAVRELVKMGVRLSYDTGSPDNFIIGTDGGKYYVDSVMNYDILLYGIWDACELEEDKILDYMMENGYKEQDIEIAKKCLNRLKVIQTTEVLEMFKKNVKKDLEQLKKLESELSLSTLEKKHGGLEIEIRDLKSSIKLGNDRIAILEKQKKDSSLN